MTNNKLNVESDLKKHSSVGVFMPLNALVSSKLASKMMKITAEKEVPIGSIVAAVTQLGIAGAFINSKSSVRVLLEQVVTEEDVAKFLRLGGVRSVESPLGVKLNPRQNPDPSKSNSKSHTLSKPNLTMKISTRTGTAIPPVLAPRLCAFLTLKFVKMIEGGAVLAEAGTAEKAGEIHETAPGAIYRVVWQGAPDV
jgi:hypothetical protein